MPIKPENAKRYPPNWQELRRQVLERAGHCCEGSSAFPDCRAPNGSWRINATGQCLMDEDAARDMLPDFGSLTRIVLTIAHIEHDELETTDISRLRAWCQKCHLAYDHEHHMQNSRKTRKQRKALGDLFDPPPAKPVQG